MGVTNLDSLTLSNALIVAGTCTLGGASTLDTVSATTISVAGTTSLLGKVVGDSTWCGTRVIATGGSATISCANVAAGPIIVTPIFTASTGTAVRRRNVAVVNRTASTFKILLSTISGGTAAAGTVAWAVINQ